MAWVEKSVLVPYSCQQMFALVDGVAAYPEFLPWCGGSEVVDVSDAVIHASVLIDYHGIKQRFTTENTRQPPDFIGITLQDGPFRHLDGGWRFVPLSESACKVEFKLHYEFSSRLLETLVGPVFHHVANSFVEAFVLRAEKIYGVAFI